MPQVDNHIFVEPRNPLYTSRASFAVMASIVVGTSLLIVVLASGVYGAAALATGILAGGAIKVSATGSSTGSAVEFETVAPPTPPPAPTNLQAFTGGNNIALVWSMPQASVQSIQVYRNNLLVTTVTPNASAALQNARLGDEYDDNGVTAGTTYTYEVRSVGASGAVSAFTPVVTATQPTSSAQVPNITINTTQAPTLASYMTTNILPLLRTWYPKVADEIAFPNYNPPTSYTITFDPSVTTAGDVCYTASSGSVATISCSPSWFTSAIAAGNTDIGAVFVHESTHVIQNGFPDDTTGWATEGGASWASDFYARQNINTYFPHPDESLGGYSVGAFFINYIRTTYNANFPKDLNVAEHNNTYTASLVPSLTGGLSVAQVWQAAINAYNTGTAPVTGIAGKCLEVQNGTIANGTKIVLDTCNGATKQQWALTYHATTKSGIFEITSPTLGNATGTAYCMDDSYSGTANGTNIQFWGCDQSNAQFWTHGPNGTIVNVNSGTCLSTNTDASADGTQIIISTCNGSSAQQWNTP
jgi:hypothetical protein